MKAGYGTKSVIIKKDGVEFLNNCDQASYYIEQLIAFALTDVAKYIKKEAEKKIPKRTGKARKNVQYWVRKRENDLQIGYKWWMKSGRVHAGFYASFYEFGTEQTPKTAPIYSSVAENIAMIQRIQAQYLTALNDKVPNIPDAPNEVMSDDN